MFRTLTTDPDIWSSVKCHYCHRDYFVYLLLDRLCPGLSPSSYLPPFPAFHFDHPHPIILEPKALLWWDGDLNSGAKAAPSRKRRWPLTPSLRCHPHLYFFRGRAWSRRKLSSLMRARETSTLPKAWKSLDQVLCGADTHSQGQGGDGWCCCGNYHRSGSGARTRPLQLPSRWPGWW